MTTVRAAAPSDAAAIGAVHVAAWRTAYVGLMPEEFLAGLRDSDYRDRWSLALKAGGGEGSALLGATPARVLVACDADSGVVGFAAIGEFRDDPAPGVGELWAINLAPAAWGTGAGTLLLAAAEAAIAAAGRRRAVLWVLHGNGRARHFYERQGWRRTARVKSDDSRGFPLRELLYEKTLPLT